MCFLKALCTTPAYIIISFDFHDKKVSTFTQYKVPSSVLLVNFHYKGATLGHSQWMFASQI